MTELRRAFDRVVEHSPLRKVAHDEFRGWFFLTTVKVGVMICVPLFALGGQLGTHMRLVEMIPAVVVGALVTALLATFTGLVGMHARVPTAVLVRTTFGDIGGKVVAAILIVTLFGWFGVQTEVLVNSLNALMQSRFGYTVDRLLLTALCGALISSTAIIGVRALGKVSYVAVPLLLVVMAVPTYVALSTHPWTTLLDVAPTGTPFSFGTVVSIITGGHIVAIAITPDITRFMRSGRDTVIGIVAGYGIVLPVLLTVAALLALIYQNGDLVAIMILTGVGGPALLVIMLATWTANDKNLYETSLALSTLLPRVERWQLTVLAAVIGTSLAAANIFGHFIAFLVFMGITIGPVAGVYLIDYAVDRGRYLRGEVQTLRKLPFVSWVIGIGVGLATLPVASGGLGLLAITSAPTLDALLGAGLAHFALQRLVTARVPAQSVPADQ